MQERKGVTLAVRQNCERVEGAGMGERNGVTRERGPCICHKDAPGAII